MLEDGDVPSALWGLGSRGQRAALGAEIGTGQGQGHTVLCLGHGDGEFRGCWLGAGRKEARGPWCCFWQLG